MPYRTLVLQKENGVATLILNRPEKLNAIKFPEMPREIGEAVEEVRQDDEIKVLVITGAGSAFCVGGEIQDFDRILRENTAEEVRTMVWEANRALFNLKNLEKPTIAAVNGDAVGGGACFAIGCDIILASTKARFGWGFTRIGLSAADMGATYLLPRIVGMTKAFELLYTGRIIDAVEAERIGLVNKVVSPEQLEAETKELAQSLAQGAVTALNMTKIAVNRGLAADFLSHTEFEAYTQTLCIQTEDFREGVKAFLEKRKPRFQGR